MLPAASPGLTENKPPCTATIGWDHHPSYGGTLVTGLPLDEAEYSWFENAPVFPEPLISPSKFCSIVLESTLTI